MRMPSALPSAAMSDRLWAWWSNPVVLLAVVAGLIAFVVQSGDLDSVDTARRLQTTHSFWTSAPPVLPNDYPEFGICGRGGRIYAWYGMGQSLLMLPADIVGTALERLPIFDRYKADGSDPSVRNIVVSYSTNILVNVLTALVCLRFLVLLGFERNHAAAGVLALLVCTTHLHYTQNMMENNFIMLLTLTGFAYQYEWLVTRNRRALCIGSAAFGFNLLTRLTTGLDLLAGAFFLVLVLWLTNVRGWALWERYVAYVRIAFPLYAVFLVIDRLYQFYRFGSFFNTYVALFAVEQRRLRPDLPANYPFETPFHVGFFGALFTPEKSIFLFDPLLLGMIFVGIVAWGRFRPEVRAYLISAWLLLFVYLCFYARYTVWSGDSAWGDRYVSTATELAAFLSVPLLLKYRANIGKVAWSGGIVLIAAAAAVQLASVAFWLELELAQMLTLGHPTLVIGLRFKNIVAFALGKAQQWHLMNPDMTDDAWDYVHITTWNFLPFVLRRVGEAPAWVVRTAFAIWTAGILSLGGTLWRMTELLRRAEKIPVQETSLA
jgi:hypothetical protein